MPLTYQVLRCFKCLVFQVHPTKKTRTWACKICDQKQSLKRFYSLGTAKECRLHVQTLNEIAGEMETKCTQKPSLSEVSNCLNVQELNEVIVDSSDNPKKSKWEDFIDANDEDNLQTPATPTPDENTSLNTDQPKKILKKGPKTQYGTKFHNKDNRSTPAKLENKSRKANPIDCKQPVTVLYKAKPNSQDVSGSKQGKLVKPGFPPAETDASWVQFVEEYSLNDPFVNNHNRSQSGPSEWFSSIDDKDLDTILEF